MLKLWPCSPTLLLDKARLLAAAHETGQQSCEGLPQQSPIT